MDDLFADRLLDAIDAKGSPICVGIDPVYEGLPDAVAGPAGDRDGNDVEAVVDAIFEFTTGVLRTVAPLVPVVKFQSAYFERYLWDGVEAYYSLIAEAKDLGLLVIGDVKRGDIGSTSAAYAAAHLGEDRRRRPDGGGAARRDHHQPDAGAGRDRAVRGTPGPRARGCSCWSAPATRGRPTSRT